VEALYQQNSTIMTGVQIADIFTRRWYFIQSMLYLQQGKSFKSYRNICRDKMSQSHLQTDQLLFEEKPLHVPTLSELQKGENY